MPSSLHTPLMIRYVHILYEHGRQLLNYIRRKIRFKRYDKALKTVVVHGQTYTRTIGSQQSQQKEA